MPQRIIFTGQCQGIRESVVPARNQCPQACTIIDAQREKTMGVLFDWTVI